MLGTPESPLLSRDTDKKHPWGRKCNMDFPVITRRGSLSEMLSWNPDWPQWPRPHCPHLPVHCVPSEGWQFGGQWFFSVNDQVSGLFYSLQCPTCAPAGSSALRQEGNATWPQRHARCRLPIVSWGRSLGFVSGFTKDTLMVRFVCKLCQQLMLVEHRG